MTDYTVGETLYFFFTTRAYATVWDGATGIPTVLAGTPVISAYEDDSATQITAGITLAVDHDSVVGLNLITVVATGGNGFEAGKQYGLVITTGTVGGVSVVGEVVKEFSLEAGAAFTRLGAPAGASVSADVAAVKAETVLIVADTNELQTDDVPGLIATLDAVVDTVKAETALIVADTNELQADDVPGLIAALDAVVDTVKAETVLILADTADMQPKLGTPAADVSADIAAVKAETALIVADTNELQTDDVPGLIATLDAVVDTVKADTAAILVDTADMQPKLGTPAADLAADVAAVKVDTAEIGAAGAGLTALATAANLATVDTNVDAILVDTGTTIPATLTALLTTAMTEAYPTDGATMTVAEALYLIAQSIGEFSIAGTTITVKKIDGSASAATYTLNDGTNPTSRTRAT